ncbi:uncharacterized protein LOC111695717 isoform X3 [Eurytemora carolleeae]|uniref:uncharacterized protein LOC111695717 isoform X1 n=1 Tax=Eurytemora carolleeae TaxID=1294199 RepID=UPI000C7889BC|nr:uncharacterized protein LOC111695717 isoform X1 [Eurytemora carolleeae]XP_023320896.1 uncharacterized protein LOC111695717 isoform X2 [Eurytemora carolleeae]XP_023320897.1 uncharacterized protein LOC111695717 isoform X3 [Eurytemora carolleeae]|eukprot:XP_023320895.1 uncharacterized protein LOC111695717 isoform X1 [Eurytemora affinis]
MTRKNLSEIVIFDAGLQNVLTKCYTTDPGKYGWCGLTIKDKTTHKNKDMDIKYDNGWGHCSDTCLDKEKISNAGKARIKPVKIMDQTYCDQELMRMIRGNNSFTVKPLVYCVAHNETYKTGFYEKLENGTYKELESKAEYHLKLNRSFPWYIRATGSCRGDSGGPLYEQRGNEYILLGTASRGAGSLETCGGIDNPTHYVRMKDMLPWITEYVSKDELCIVN